MTDNHEQPAKDDGKADRLQLSRDAGLHHISYTLQPLPGTCGTKDMVGKRRSLREILLEFPCHWCIKGVRLHTAE